MSEPRNPDKLEDVGGDPVGDGKQGLEPAPDPRVKVDPAWESGDSYYQRQAAPAAPRPTRDGDFTPMTWVMIVIAGVALGFAIAMTFAGG
jgi:hypothetical protein